MLRNERADGARRIRHIGNFNMPSGAIYLAMGPSGAGKDTLLLGARAALSNDPRVHFISRRLTRSADRTTDIEISVTPEEFARAEAVSYTHLTLPTKA